MKGFPLFITVALQTACLREPTAGAAYGYASRGSPVFPARPGRCSSGGRPPRAVLLGAAAGARTLPREPGSMAFTGVDTIDTLSRGRSNCRPALSSVSLMFSGFFSLLLTACLTSWLMLIYCLEFAPSLPCNMSVALCSCCLLYSLYPRSWFHLPPVSLDSFIRMHGKKSIF